MNAPSIADNCDDDQKKYDDEDDALFVFGEFENPEQAFHLIVA
jgi:hypothetical protein